MKYLRMYQNPFLVNQPFYSVGENNELLQIAENISTVLPTFIAFHLLSLQYDSWWCCSDIKVRKEFSEI